MNVIPGSQYYDGKGNLVLKVWIQFLPAEVGGKKKFRGSDIRVTTSNGPLKNRVGKRIVAEEYSLNDRLRERDSSQSFGVIQIVVLSSIPFDTELIIRVNNIGLKVRTLPKRKNEVYLFLSSCYHQESDNGNAKKFMEAQKELPHLKINCGDQVYMDDPPKNFKVEKLRLTYDKYWDHNNLGGYLRLGSNIFSPDDHDFWNNYPLMGSNQPHLCFNKNKRLQRKVPHKYYDYYQRICNPKRKRSFSIDFGHFSLFNLDTRSERKVPKLRSKDILILGEMDQSKSIFSHPDDIKEFEKWITNLKKPGVLVLGQPLFLKNEEISIGDRLPSDLTLYEFEIQYQIILDNIVNKSKFDILVLSGDVHFGRASEWETKKGHFIYEIISSPLSLIPAQTAENQCGPIVKGAFKAGPYLKEVPIVSLLGRTIEDNLKESGRPKEIDLLRNFKFNKKFDTGEKINVLMGTLKNNVARIRAIKQKDNEVLFKINWADVSQGTDIVADNDIENMTSTFPKMELELTLGKR